VISDEVFAFLSGGKSLVLGTRDATLVPEAARATGVKAWPDRKHISVYIVDGVAAKTLANLRENGQLAMTVSHPPDHRTLQIKGRLVALTQATEEERALVDSYAHDFAQVLDALGVPAHLLMRVKRWPCHRADVLVQEIYQQTPGPNAGTQLGKGAP
jgi:hypothetical protein